MLLEQVLQLEVGLVEVQEKVGEQGGLREEFFVAGHKGLDVGGSL